MAKETVNILKDKIDIVELLAQLNAALSEEWLAFYQYWVGSFVVEGAMRGDVQREFQEHAAEEYNHAKLLADRIIELEGVPVLDPKQWFDLARCKYDAPVDFGSEVLLNQSVALSTAISKLPNSPTELISLPVTLPNISWLKKKTTNKICRII
jgi:bacterioferritin